MIIAHISQSLNYDKHWNELSILRGPEHNPTNQCKKKLTTSQRDCGQIKTLVLHICFYPSIKHILEKHASKTQHAMIPK